MAGFGTQQWYNAPSSTLRGEVLERELGDGFLGFAAELLAAGSYETAGALSAAFASQLQHAVVTTDAARLAAVAAAAGAECEMAFSVLVAEELEAPPRGESTLLDATALDGGPRPLAFFAAPPSGADAAGRAVAFKLRHHLWRGALLTKEAAWGTAAPAATELGAVTSVVGLQEPCMLRGLGGTASSTVTPQGFGAEGTLFVLDTAIGVDASAFESG
ncbi:hypothetical protein MNEG_13865 [Monoraphidium neglectum]|uniref:Uncharacterized protein n=1 Tax=Monoraphidium neglectum TaxID=145388 RepID=A0A0D2LX68_9CHLO|nr:hypothetical protein MNEG_13865 [Monoraphidium neglectum]KIY94096.1 hypothetical protein MNEG_13865 [Monoraphidium neglectum]|eukprot:XP_013893116.1 hypothetical protein MNEG_13865 [Monoraphidium neglectum]